LSGLVPEYYSGILKGDIQIGNNAGSITSWKDVPLYEKATTVGTVFQDPRHQFFPARVEQELLLSMWRNEAVLADKQKKVSSILEHLAMEDFFYRLLDTLSSGEQQ
jgi:energy-coupling factor transport system ATP-binding protein